MKYESLEPVTHEQAEAIARSGDAHALSRIAVSIALADRPTPRPTTSSSSSARSRASTLADGAEEPMITRGQFIDHHAEDRFPVTPLF